ncbi:hypothetical protein L3X38_000793 [Prunus dulcis]|uniref:Uncharacterized protein n=1 Tax=Prunus dulcis TaxID=3755 RepID=A0AAD4WRD4_PRUDU|nr:hypothetical protein L3X38_000793 [Prunus dulcis]
MILSALGWGRRPPSRICSWELTEQLPRVVTHPGIAPASNSLNFGVPTTPKPEIDCLRPYEFSCADDGARHLRELETDRV